MRYSCFIFFIRHDPQAKTFWVRWHDHLFSLRMRTDGTAAVMFPNTIKQLMGTKYAYR